MGDTINENNSTMKMVLADFDDTIIDCDSMVTILKKEKWYLDISLLIAGAKIVLAKIFHGDIYARRSAFKFLMMCKYNDLSESKKAGYISFLKEHINNDVVHMIENIQSDKIVVASASDKSIIEAVLDGLCEYDVIIANELHKETDEFRTCYGEEKARRFCASVPDYKDYEIYVFSDSMSDKPIFDLGTKRYLVCAGEIKEI